MIELRLSGWSYSSLGREFGKEHTTIMYHCKRLIESERPTRLEEEEYSDNPLKLCVVPKYAYLMDEKLCEGKTYKEYLAESLKRPAEKHYFKLVYGCA